MLAYVQIDGAHTAMPIQVVTAPTNVFVGQKVTIKFREKRKGDLMDICAVPVKGQRVPEGSCLHGYEKNVKDLNRDLENTYAFLDKRFSIQKKDV